MHVCLFDIDGTLLNTGGAGAAAMEAVLREEFGMTRPVSGIPYAGRTDRSIVGDLLRFYGIEHTPEVTRRFIAAYLRRLPECLAEREGLVLPGVPELLDALTGREGYALGLLTGNFAEGAKLKLEYYGLHGHFRFGGFGDHHLHRDDVARAALDEAHRVCGDDVDPARLWVIGDTPSDVRCGRAIGARVIAVATGVFREEQLAAERPDHLFADFSDTDAVLRLLT